MRVDKKGAIDLVTEIDLEVERGFRALIGERFPDHVVLGEEFSRARTRRGGRSTAGCSIRSTGPRTTRTACPYSAPRWRSKFPACQRWQRFTIPAARELFTAERGQGAWLNGAPLRVSHPATLIDSLLCTGFPYSVQQDAGSLVGLFAEFLWRVACRAAAGFRGAGSLLRRRRAAGWLLGAVAPSLGHGGRRADRPGGRRPRDRFARRTLQLAPREHRGDERGCTRADGGHNRYVLQTSGRRPVDCSPKLRTGPGNRRSAAATAVCSRADGLTSDEYTPTRGNPGFTQVLALCAWHCSCSCRSDWAGPARKGASRNGASDDETDVAAGPAVITRSRARYWLPY